jgi:diguanylate cyclase (GGDEF)-like protein
MIAVEAAGAIIGRDPDADLVVEDTGVSRHHARVACAPDGGFYVEDLGSTNGTFVGTARIGIAPLVGGETIRLGPQMRVRFAVLDATVESLYRRLYESSVRDPLTHLFNRQYLAGRVVAEVAHAQRTRSDLALLIADVDSFKQVNDRFGHLAGDRALCTVGARMMRTIRIDDVLARYGGDEFVILAPATGTVEALHLGERVCRTIQELRLSARGQSVPITLSIGIASLGEVSGCAAHIPALFALADSRLYGAKAAGRNRVVAAGMVPTIEASPPPGG